MRYILIILLLIASPLLAQNGKRINRHKLYDTTSVDHKVKSRQLTADVDSTGIAMYAWGDECYFKINLLERMLIRSNYYDRGMCNGHPYLQYGDNKLRFKMYINESGNFEFDAVIRKKLKNGRHEIPFNIETKGLNFYFQDTIMDNRKGIDFRPDSVIYSYAVYHESKRDNRIIISGKDTTFESYGTGKAFHLYRPKAWDNAGDTVWGYLRITEDMMFIGVDSSWMATAEYPVTIDPVFGNESNGGGLTVMSANQMIFMINDPATTGAGTIDSALAYMKTYADNAKVAVYDYDSDDHRDSPLHAESNTSQSTDYAWMKYTFTSPDALEAGHQYAPAVMGSSGWRIYYDGTSASNTKIYNEASYVFPDPAGIDDDSWSNIYSICVWYTVAGGEPDELYRRRRILTK